MAPFSPSDVIEEYTRPARIRRSGRNVTELPYRTATWSRFRIRFHGRFYDGVRSLLNTIDSQELLEYTVRWPGHIDRYLAGNDSEDELIAAWQFDSGRPEFTWLSVLVTKGQQSWKWDVIDEGMNGWSSMARATGLVTVEVAEMLADYTITDVGVMPPERLGEEKILLDRVVEAMRREGVQSSQILTHDSSSSE